jgi:hypothetical protein
MSKFKFKFKFFLILHIFINIFFFVTQSLIGEKCGSDGKQALKKLIEKASGGLIKILFHYLIDSNSSNFITFRNHL